MSITLVTKKEGIFPVVNDDKIQVVVAGEERLCEKSLWIEQFRNVHSLAEKHEGVGIGFSNEALIIAIFSEVAAWRGSAGIDDMVINQVNELIRKAKTSIVISFGSPYILRYFRDADVLLAAYEANVHIQGAVIKCLKGETYFKGWLPVRL